MLLRGAIGNDTDMGLFIWNGRGGMSDDEVALSMPDLSEAKSLPRHIERCGMRYKLMVNRQAQQGDDIVAIKYMLIVLIILAVVESQQARDVISWVMKSL